MSINGSEELDQVFDTETETTTPNPTLWSTEKSIDLYRMNVWGEQYYTINSLGNIVVRTFGNDTETDQEIDLLEVVTKALESEYKPRPPIIIRFPDMLQHCMKSLKSAFDQAIETKGYKSHYQGVYPVKSNQDKFIVQDIVQFGFGLESGSKPELLLAMSCLCEGESNEESFLICNGYKDSEYVKLAFIARRLQLNAIIVLELESELDIVIKLARELNTKPVLGVRAKLLTKHNGHFGSTAGVDGKFGLTRTQIERVVESLKSLEMLDCLQLLHFHIGSQIPSIEKLTECIREGAQIYTHLVESGASMRIIDVGGGLAVDYGSTGENSINYRVKDYANAVVEAIMRVCNEVSVEHPIICSESGRAIASHHSVLVFEAFSRSETTYHANLSIFTSIPDYWGIQQYFPIMPIHRLGEKPCIRGVLSDITCDSDGMVKKFTGREEGEDGLMLHELEGSGKYYLGMFLGGAYQEALGGHHNLFGRATVVRVEQRADGFQVTNVMIGPTCGEILRVMHHDPVAMVNRIQNRAEEVNEDHVELGKYITAAFNNTPYLEFDKNGHVGGENGDELIDDS